MAQWNHKDRTIFAKLVYYGPAFGGKTTNLETLHRLTDPEGAHQLLSVKTANDRTLFFDLLPMELGDILGYKFAIKVYTVPGQVRYDATRKMVLAGADAVVFVADSSRQREQQNQWSLQNLAVNMRANGLDPERIPVLHQFNKQDLADAAPPEEVAGWLGVAVGDGFPAVATVGRGVIETFVVATQAMVRRIVEMADLRTRQQLDPDAMCRRVEESFAGHLARFRRQDARREDDGAAQPIPLAGAVNEVNPEGDTLPAQALAANIEIAEKLADQTTRTNRLQREADSLLELSATLKNVGASFDRETIFGAILQSACRVLEVPAVTLLREDSSGSVVLERSEGWFDDPLLAVPEGRELAMTILESGAPRVVDDLAQLLHGPEAAVALNGVKAVAAAPVICRPRRLLLAYAAPPSGVLTERDASFLSTLADHLAVGLEKVGLHELVSRHRDRLEATVQARTEELRAAYEELRRMEALKDHFLSNLSHEMKTPLTAVLSSATFLRDYGGDEEQRREMLETIVASAGRLQGLLENLFRVVRLESAEEAIRPEELDAAGLVAEAVQLASGDTVRTAIDPALGRWVADRSKLARAVANLLDNALKFAPPESVELRIGPGTMPAAAGTPSTAVSISVLDRGRGVALEDRERIFAPFEQGGNVMTDKPAGVGLGLHEARRIAEQHGGRLDYRPRDGGGSEFRMIVPADPQAQSRMLEARGA